MKIQNLVISIFMCILLTPHIILNSDFSDLSNQAVDQIVAKIDEKTAQHILDGLHKQQLELQQKIEPSENNTFDILLSQFEEKITPLSQAALAKHNQQNQITSLGFGVTAACAAFNYEKIMNALSGAEQKRIFIIDDLMAAGAAKSIWNAIVPSVVTGIAGFFAWRQVDYYLHAEERSRFAILEHEIHEDVIMIRKEFTNQLATKDKESLQRQKTVYQYIDKAIKAANTQHTHEIKTLSDHCEKEEVYLKELIRSLTQEHENQNQTTVNLISNAHDSIERTSQEIASVLEKVQEMQKNNLEMQNGLKKMTPIMNRIVQGIEAHNAKPHNTHAELLSIHIPSQDDSEHKSQTPATKKRQSIMSQISKISTPFKRETKTKNNSATPSADTRKRAGSSSASTLPMNKAFSTNSVHIEPATTSSGSDQSSTISHLPNMFALFGLTATKK